MKRPGSSVALATRLLVVGVAVVAMLVADVTGAIAAPPANDAFSSPLVLAPLGGSLTGTSVDATVEVAEPFHAGDRGGSSVWYSWTPAPSLVGKFASVATTGSGFDTLLAEYTGASLASLVLGSANDDTDPSGATHTSRMCFPIVNSTTYRIAVDGFGGAEGSVTLTWGEKTDSAPCPASAFFLSGLPGVVDAPKVGDRLSASSVCAGPLSGCSNSWVGDVTSITTAWIRCQGDGCSVIPDGTGADYVLKSRDVGTKVFAMVTAFGPSGSAAQSSDMVGAVGMPPVIRQNGRIGWVTNRTFPNWDVYTAASDGSSLTRLTDAPAFETEPAWSPDGSRLAYVSDGNIATMNFDGSGKTVIGPGTFPRWSPDGPGSRLAFLTATGIQVANANGTSSHQLFSAAGGTVTGIDWSPDGTALVFAYDSPSLATGNDLYLMDASGFDLPSLLVQTASNDWEPSWSADGSKIVFSRSDPNTSDGDLYVVNANGSGEAPLFTPTVGASEEYPDYSPDGTKIVFDRFVLGNSELFVVNANGSGPPTQITFDGNRDEIPQWGAAYTPPPPPPPSGGGGGSSGGGGGGAGPADLYLTGSVEPVSAPVGGTLTWRLRVADDKNFRPATGVLVDLTLPAGVQVVSASADRGPGCASSGAGTLRCNLDWLSSDALYGNITLVTNVTQAGELVLGATVSYSQVDSDPANNTLTLKANTPAPVVPTPAPPKPSAIVKPEFGKPLTLPALAVAGKRFTFTLAVNRSGTSTPLRTGKMVADPTVAGKLIKHAESFKAGKARLSLVLPKTAKGKLLKVKIKITASGQTTTRLYTYTVR